MSTKPATEQPKKPRKAPVRHKNDPELLRYAALGRIFDQMKTGEQTRAIWWLFSKYGQPGLSVSLNGHQMAEKGNWEALGSTISPPAGS